MGQISAKHFTTTTTMSKRKRTSDTINPLSHNQTTIKQLSVAGLTEHDLLPSTYIPDFPHRPIRPSHLAPPPTQEDEDDDNNDADASSGGRPETKKKKTPGGGGGGGGGDAQEQHVGVLVAVVLRGLAEGAGDGHQQQQLARARRAFGLLWRARAAGGKPVDLRRQGLWALGAELVMREGEERSEDNKDRWGAAANTPRLRAYLECLARQYPYNRLHPAAVSALDFYPVLFACEAYDAWVEHRRARARLEAAAEAWGDDDDDDDEEVDDVFIKLEPPSPSREDSDENDNENEWLHLPARERRLRDERERLRAEALATVRGLAARMDALLADAPYNRSAEMLRLRGMLALFADDLVGPSPAARAEERARARAFFVRMREQLGDGVVDGRVQRWIQQGEDGDNEDEDDGEDAYKYDVSEDHNFSPGLPVFSSLPLR